MTFSLSPQTMPIDLSQGSVLTLFPFWNELSNIFCDSLHWMFNNSFKVLFISINFQYDLGRLHILNFTKWNDCMVYQNKMSSDWSSSKSGSYSRCNSRSKISEQLPSHFWSNIKSKSANVMPRRNWTPLDYMFCEDFCIEMYVHWVSEMIS